MLRFLAYFLPWTRSFFEVVDSFPFSGRHRYIYIHVCKVERTLSSLEAE